VSLSLTIGFDLGRRHAVPPGNDGAVFAEGEMSRSKEVRMAEFGGARSIALRVGGFRSCGAMLRAPGFRRRSSVKRAWFGGCGFFRHAQIN